MLMLDWMGQVTREIRLKFSRKHNFGLILNLDQKCFYALNIRNTSVNSFPEWTVDQSLRTFFLVIINF